MKMIYIKKKDNKGNEFNDEVTTPYLSLNALKDTTRFHTLRFT